MAEKNHPFAFVVSREIDLSLGGHGFKSRCIIPDAGHCDYLIVFHDFD
jgi:hypothetical protein